MKNLIKKWLGIDKLEKDRVYTVKFVENDAFEFLEKGSVIRDKDLALFTEKMAQKYNRAMIKSLIKKVLEEDNNLR